MKYKNIALLPHASVGKVYELVYLSCQFKGLGAESIAPRQPSSPSSSSTKWNLAGLVRLAEVDALVDTAPLHVQA